MFLINKKLVKYNNGKIKNKTIYQSMWKVVSDKKKINDTNNGITTEITFIQADIEDEYKSLLLSTIWTNSCVWTAHQKAQFHNQYIIPNKNIENIELLNRKRDKKDIINNTYDT